MSRGEQFHSYRQDLDNFYLKLSQPPDAGKELTMWNYGDLISYNHDGFMDPINYRNMDGSDIDRSKFDREQIDVLDNAYHLGRHYSFLCYPDIPATVMKALFYFAEGHNALSYRIPLWKVARSGIKDGAAAQVACRLLDFGVCAPDVVLIDNAVIMRWFDLHKQICMVSGLNPDSDDISASQVSNEGLDMLRKEAERLRGA